MARLLACLAPALVALTGCAAPVASCRVPDTGGGIVTVVEHGWHVDIGIATDDISGSLTAFRTIFPGARALMFGYGKKTFLTAPANTVSEYLLGPVPGPALIEVTGLKVPPSVAYPGEDTIVLPLPPGGARALSEFLWRDLETDGGQKPRLVAPGQFPGSLFYAARSRYSLAHTCNTWAADALRAAGLPVRADGVVFSGAVMSRAADARAAYCRSLPATWRAG